MGEILVDLRNPTTLALAQAAERQRGSIEAAAQVCKAAGFRVGRSLFSLYLSNNLPNVTNIEAAIVACFDTYPCPYLGREIAAEHCRDANAGPVPTWDPSALDQRRCCQTCPHKPNASETLKGETK